MINVRRSDLNLFVVLEVLLQERSVTRAATRLGLSQPAVSSALGRLRRLLDDELLVRSGHGMQPTPRAEQLAGSISRALDLFQAALKQETHFDPADATRTFTVMMSDIGEIIYLPQLLVKLRSDAPGITLTVRRLNRSRLAEELARGGVDLALGWVGEMPDAVMRRRLFEEKYVCILRSGHPRIANRLSLTRFNAEQHLVVGRKRQRSEHIQDLMGHGRLNDSHDIGAGLKIAHTVSHYLAVPAIVASSDLLCIIPRRLAEVYASDGKVRHLPLPFELGTFPISQLWHKRYDRDGGNLWLRTITANMFGD